MVKLDFKNQVNAVGGVSLAVVALFFAYEFTRTSEVGPCTGRYPTATDLTLVKQDGTALSPGELQARVGFGETGVLEKGSVLELRDAPSKTGLNIKVGGDVETDTGLSFFWAPKVMGKVASACLSYDIYLPAEFDFSRGGRLPGLFGGSFAGFTAVSGNGVGMHLTWDERGQVGLESVVPGPADSKDSVMIKYSSDVELARGRWVRFDQEVVFNTPGEENGILRMWVDGRLKLSDTSAVWRTEATAGLQGAWADIGYLTFGGVERNAQKQSNIIISPPRLSWQ